MLKFQEENTYEERLALYNKVRIKCPNRYFVIVEPATPLDPSISKTKYVIPYNMPMSSVINEIRPLIQIESHHALAFYVGPKNNEHLLSLALSIDYAYTLYHENDGFLYITYTRESTFG